MATAEQPLKKRKLYEAPPPQPPQQQPPPPPLPPPIEKQEPQVAPPRTPLPLSHEEIHRRRRNQEEIRSVYENYKTIKRCISNKDARHMPELEQAYLSLISSSRGCASVQRILSEFIPRYASYCPTALEAAAQVVINMHNWNVPIICRGDDGDGVSFETVKNCIVGLVDICSTASLEAPSSSVIRGICSAVFIDVATFFASCVEGRDIFQLINKESLKVQDSVETFACMKQRILEEDTCVSDKLFKLRALCFLRILFLCPKDLLAACFELFCTSATDGICREGKYLLSQLSSALCIDDEAHVGGSCDAAKAIMSHMAVDSEESDISHRRTDSDRENLSKNGTGLLNSCLLEMVLHRKPSLKKWVFSRYQRLRKSASSEAVSQVITAFEKIFESFTEQIKAQDNMEESDNDASDSPKYVSRQYVVHEISDQRGSLCEISGKETTSQDHDKSCKDGLPIKIAGQYLKHHGSMASLETDHHSNTSSNHDSGGSKGKSFDAKDQGDRRPVWSPMPKDFCSERLLSPVPGMSDIKAEPYEVGDHAGKNHSSNADSLRFSGGLAGSTYGSSPGVAYPSQCNQTVWYSDGDPLAMDVLSASRLLWLGSIVPEASEAAVRYEFERFGPLDNFSFFPATGFALVEFRSILHSIKARDFFRRYSPWGHPVRIKFVDIGLGTRGVVNGVAIGSSCHVFVGNVFSQWVKDEIMSELMKAIRQGPRMVSELTSEGALLLEFETPEEAANAMACIRQLRRGSSNFSASISSGFADILRPRRSFWDAVRTPGSNAVGNVGSNFLGSPDGQTVPSPSNRIHNTAVHFETKPVGIPLEFSSPRSSFEQQAMTMRSGQVAHSNVTVSGYADMDAGSNKGPSEQMYQKPELEMQSAAISIPCPPTQGPAITPPVPMQAQPYVRPVYPPPSNSWDGHSFNHHMPLGSIAPSFMPTNMHNNAIPPHFVQASVTPFPQMSGSSVLPYNQMIPQNVAPPLVPPIPQTKPDIPPPLPPSPLSVPPPPSSPPSAPPPPAGEPVSHNTKPLTMGPAGSSMQIQWQGTLSKSGVHYCNIYANRIDSNACKYTSSFSEPVGWPAKLDMMKRTDLKHVKATFTNTASHRRELCQLVPVSASDQKGFQDFIAYLKQRECVGVIKLPATKPLWARLLFILPYSSEVCSMLSISSEASDGLIALVLPKDANSECS